MATLEERKELAAKKLEQYGQTHVLKYYDTLTADRTDRSVGYEICPSQRRAARAR